MSEPTLTIFSTPKPFTLNAHIATIQRNAVANWKALGDSVAVVLIGDEPGMASVARELNTIHIPDVETNALGTPLLSSIFAQAHQVNHSPLLAFCNNDILLMPDFIEVAQIVASQFDRFLVVGQRYDLDVRETLDLTDGWQGRLAAEIRQRGRLHPPGGSDYFIFPRGSFERIPPFAIGRAGWDNWMLFAARRQGWPLVDATGAITIAHQDHDYSHLPNSQPHYRLPETAENVRLAGGSRVIFTLRDCSHRVVEGRVQRAPLTWRRFWRELEIFPLVRLGSKALAQAIFALLHPRKAWSELRAARTTRRNGAGE